MTPIFRKTIFGFLDYPEFTQLWYGATNLYKPCCGTTKSQEGIFEERKTSGTKLSFLLTLDQLLQNPKILGNAT